MTIFAVIPQPNVNSDKLGAAIAEAYPNDNYLLDGGHGWLVSAKGTPKQVSDALKITDGVSGAAVIVEVASYFGRANPNIWNWIKEKWESAGV
jgi:hypothetical protein